VKNRHFQAEVLSNPGHNINNSILSVNCPPRCHDWKGKKDGTFPLPETIVPKLKEHLEKVMELHKEDLEWGYSGCFLFDLIERKYKNAARKLEWQWFFPAKTLTFVPDKDDYIVVSVPKALH
jgi:hypothetical protein